MLDQKVKRYAILTLIFADLDFQFFLGERDFTPESPIKYGFILSGE